MSRRKKILIISGGLIFFLYLLSSIFGGESYTPEVKTETVQIIDITEKVSASGKIQPELEVNISAEVSGQLIQLATWRV